MYNVTSDSKIMTYYNKVVDEIDRELQLEVKLNNTVVPTSNILNSLDIEFDYGEGLSVGTIMYGKLETSFISDVAVKENDVIQIAISIKYFDEELHEYEWLKVPFYAFEVVEVQKTKFSSKVTGYSKGYNKLQQIFTVGTDIETISSEQVITRIVNQGITYLENTQAIAINYDFNVGSLGTKTYSEMLQIIAQQNGVNIIPSRNGNFKFVVGLPDTEITLDNSQLISPEIGTALYELKKVSVDVDSETTYTSGEQVAKEHQTLQFANTYFTQDMVDNIYVTFSGYSFYPYESEVYQPRLEIEPLDMIHCGEYDVPLMQMKLTIGRDLKMEFASSVKTETSYNKSYSLSQKMEEAIESNSNLEGDVNKLRNEVAYIQQNYPTTSDVQDMIANVETGNSSALDGIKEELNAKIDANTKAIEGKCSSADVPSLIEEASDSVGIAFNKISTNYTANANSFAFNANNGAKYFTFDNNGMSIYNPTTNPTELAKIKVGSDTKVLIGTKTASKGISLGYFNSSNVYVEVMLIKDVVDMKNLIAQHNHIALATNTVVNDCISDSNSLYVIGEIPIVNVDGNLTFDKAHIPSTGNDGSVPTNILCNKDGYVDVNQYIFYLHSAIRALNEEVRSVKSKNSTLESKLDTVNQKISDLEGKDTVLENKIKDLENLIKQNIQTTTEE